MSTDSGQAVADLSRNEAAEDGQGQRQSVITSNDKASSPNLASLDHGIPSIRPKSTSLPRESARIDLVSGTGSIGASDTATDYFARPNHDIALSRPLDQHVTSLNSQSPPPVPSPVINQESPRPQALSTQPRSGSLFARIKAIASPVAGDEHRQVSYQDLLASHALDTPTEPSNPRDPITPASPDHTADVQHTLVSTSKSAKRKRSMRFGADSPSTPATAQRHSRLPSFFRDMSHTHFALSDQSAHQSPPKRRASLTDMPQYAATGGSEDEGRQRLASRWRRGPSQSADNRRDSRRPTAFRRLTTFAASAGPLSPVRPRGDRTSTGTQKWRQVKAGLRMLGQRRRDERVRVDHQKSAELMAQLLAGSPAALFLASMYQRDEHGRRKIPALLEQLKISIPTSTTREDSSGDRHMIFTINLEYGNGPSRMSWTIQRSLRDFLNLHLKYKVQNQTDKLKRDDRHRAKTPRFPKSAFPYLRGVRGLGDEDMDDDDVDIDPAPPEAESGHSDGPDQKPKRAGPKPSHALVKKPSFHQRHSSHLNVAATKIIDAITAVGHDPATPSKTAHYPDRQRKKLEIYLQQMIRWLIFRPESTRLCKFLELSAIAMRLSVEGGYHGKEGLLTIASKRSVERGGLTALRAIPGRLKSSPQRHRPKWFLVRHSYIMAVNSPESLEPIEVFLVDSDFTTDKKKRLRDKSSQDISKAATASAQPKYHALKLYNSERKLRLVARNERQFLQFKESIAMMQRQTVWSHQHRFDSFAPVRTGVFARWLVDGRDHMWQVSRAIDNARSFVYIHDWWLSPELYLRRPAAISQKWRLDRLLLKKAREGVKIFVIVYRNIESAVPIDSEYTKAALLDLHPNICVQRSPNQFRQNQFFWAHHEKLVVIDNAMAFVGGVDLCYGRWDDPSHSLTDDKLTGFELDWAGDRNGHNCQMWPGKDYSNPRVQDFYALDRPYEEMYDRTKVPRMPWHDIAMTIVGQPARDIGRHFVQRWNYILRQRTPSRPTPILLPPPDFGKDELEQLGMTGTCQIQMLRSCASWSMGTPNRVECSIQNAYVHLIETSEHFVYIENQFFVSSCTVEGVTIQNRIGDALVERIERAHLQGEAWRACIVIPLMPGFQNTVDAQDGTSIRLIMQCQFRSICRGETSIFGRLRASGIDPRQYIEFYGLRQWGKIGPHKSLVTEQLYIHAKCMIVDDRHCIIGSANINDRSMVGSRDSEVAAVIADQDLVPSSMGGKPYNVGIFPHTLRMRLMREHLGLEVDDHTSGDDGTSVSASVDAEMDRIYDDNPNDLTSPPTLDDKLEQNTAELTSLSSSGNARHRSNSVSLAHLLGNDKESSVRIAREKHDLDVAGYGADNMAKLTDQGVTRGRDAFVNQQNHEMLIKPDEAERKLSLRPTSTALSDDDHKSQISPTPPWNLGRTTTRDLGLTQLSQLPPLPVADDSDIGGPALSRPATSHTRQLLQYVLQNKPLVDDECMKDPLVDSFYRDVWHKVAENNTKLYQTVFHCMPDSAVQTWREYREYNAYNEKFMQSQGLGVSKQKPAKEAPDVTGPPGAELATGVNDSKASTGALKAGSRLSGLAKSFLRPGTSASSRSKPEISEKPRAQSTTDTVEQPSPIANNEQFNEKAGLQEAANSTDTKKFSPSATDPEKQMLELGRRKQSNQAQVEDEKGEPEGRVSSVSQLNEQSSPVSSHDALELPLRNSSHGSGKPITPQTTQTQRRRRATTKGASSKPTHNVDEVLSKDDAEEMVKNIQGTLVSWPYDWLIREEAGGNWLYNIDQIAPLEI